MKSRLSNMTHKTVASLRYLQSLPSQSPAPPMVFLFQLLRFSLNPCKAFQHLSSSPLSLLYPLPVILTLTNSLSLFKSLPYDFFLQEVCLGLVPLLGLS